MNFELIGFLLEATRRLRAENVGHYKTLLNRTKKKNGAFIRKTVVNHHLEKALLNRQNEAQLTAVSVRHINTIVVPTLYVAFK